MVELGVVGAKNSGKTKVIEGLVGYLAGEGRRVATIKHTSHTHRFDTPGKDSYRHRQAGARLTVAISEEEVAIFAPPDTINTRQLQLVIGRQIDIWLVEGDWGGDRPKILVTQDLRDLPDPLPENIVATIGPEQLSQVPAHFAMGDFSGLGSLVSGTILDPKTEFQT